MAVPNRNSRISIPAGDFPPWARWHDDELRIDLHVQPGARRSALLGVHGDRLKVAVHAPPAEGEANEELLRFLAERLGVPLRTLRLVSGKASRRKSLAVRADPAQASGLLGLLAGPAR